MNKKQISFNESIFIKNRFGFCDSKTTWFEFRFDLKITTLYKYNNNAALYYNLGRIKYLKSDNSPKIYDNNKQMCTKYLSKSIKLIEYNQFKNDNNNNNNIFWQPYCLYAQFFENKMNDYLIAEKYYIKASIN